MPLLIKATEYILSILTEDETVKQRQQFNIKIGGNYQAARFAIKLCV